MKVETFILVPNIEVKVPLTPKDFEKKFINIEDKDRYQEIERIIKNSKDEYYYGFIRILHNDLIIFGEEFLDYLPIYWMVFTDIIHTYLMEEFVETILPGYEIKLSFKKMNNDVINIKLGDEMFKLPNNEFLINLLKGGKIFFYNHMKITGSNTYSNIIMKINSMLNLLLGK
ncbi:hypothetical protein ACH0B5_05665 [Ureibacillus sp. 179-F W5.1 NHS]|uniref:Uncharacterized protein n=1 Tax=Lysinibacillus halotolerans TaxID=1368476 RepID=A0A3M8HFB0_9BACI|nr:hypothetical protein [Lysinibacillus halotolerans]RND01090.1 hypothetical protein EC501_02185 [Lysinibacillus halotolerans]